MNAIVEGVVPSSAGNLYAINALVANPRAAILPGSTAILRLPLGARAVVVVPSDALVREGDLTGVTLRATDGDHTRWVRLGAAVGRIDRSDRWTERGRRRRRTVLHADAALTMGIAGRVAHAFLRSKLTPLITVASLAVGLLGILATPREEEPQISVPMIDVIAALPGASPHEAENLLARPIEQRMLEIPGVEHVYSISGDGYAMVTVRFKVGEDQERSVTRVHAKLASVDGSPARRCLAAARQAALHRRRAGPGAHAALHACTTPTRCARSPCIWRTRFARFQTSRRHSSWAASRSSFGSRSTPRASRPAA